MNDMTIAGIGHNATGPYIPEALKAKLEDFTDAAGAWLDKKEIDSPEQAEKCTDFLSGAKALLKDFDAERKSQKKPHDDAGKAVQELFKTPMYTLDTMISSVGRLHTAFLKAERDRAEAKRRAELEAAAKAQAEAAERRRRAEVNNDVAGMVAADEQRQAAEDAAKEAAKPVKAQAGSATGGARTMALRTTWRCEVENRGPALAHFRDHPEVIALIERLATAEVRAQKGEKAAPKGFKLIKEEKSA
jgi:hypothetical protein